MSTTNSGGISQSEIVVSVKDDANATNSTARDREATRNLARALVPDIEWLARRGGTKIVVKD